jgi:cytosine/creatinine deaminase
MEFVDKIGLEAAISQAKKSYNEGGIPIGSALVYHGSDSEGPRVLGLGHNQRIQKASATLHGEISALENAGRLKPDMYRNSTMAS